MFYSPIQTRDDEHVILGQIAASYARDEEELSPKLMADVAVTPDGSLLASVGCDRTVKSWDVANGWNPDHRELRAS